MLTRLKIKTLQRYALVLTASYLAACSQVQEQPSVNESQSEANTQLVSPYQRAAQPAASDAKKRFNTAREAMKVRDWPEAKKHLNWLIEHYPSYSGPVLNMAVVYEQQGQLALAEQSYRKALRVNKLNLKAYNRYAIFLRQQGRFSEAEQSYAKALAVWQYDADTHRNVGILYELYMGRLPEAQQHYLQYLQLREQAQSFNADKAYKQVKGWTMDVARRLKRQEQSG